MFIQSRRTNSPKVGESSGFWIELILGATLILFVSPLIGKSHVDNQRVVAFHYPGEVWVTDLARFGQGIGRKERLIYVGEVMLRLFFYTVDEYSPLKIDVLGWNGPIVFENYIKLQNWIDDSRLVNSDASQLDAIDVDIWPYGGLIRGDSGGRRFSSGIGAVLGTIDKAPGESSVDDYGKESETLNPDLYKFSGIVLFVGGASILLLTWWKMNFDLSLNLHFARYASLLGLSFVLVWLGMGLIGHGFGFI